MGLIQYNTDRHNDSMTQEEVLISLNAVHQTVEEDWNTDRCCDRLKQNKVLEGMARPFISRIA